MNGLNNQSHVCHQTPLVLWGWPDIALDNCSQVLLTIASRWVMNLVKISYIGPCHAQCFQKSGDREQQYSLTRNPYSIINGQVNKYLLFVHDKWIEQIVNKLIEISVMDTKHENIQKQRTTYLNGQQWAQFFHCNIHASKILVTVMKWQNIIQKSFTWHALVGVRTLNGSASISVK